MKIIRWNTVSIICRENSWGLRMMKILFFNPLNTKNISVKPIVNMIFLQITVATLIVISGCKQVTDLEGDYIITAMHSQKVLGVSSGNLEIDTDVFQQNRLSEVSKHQVWTMRLLEDDSYTIVSKKTGKALTIEGASEILGAKLIQETYIDVNSQKFRISEAFINSNKKNIYTITNVNSEMKLSVEEASIDNVGIEQQKYHLGALYQQWKFEPISIDSSPYRIGESYFGNRDFIEYVRGDLPIVIIAPHGGKLRPDDLPIHSDHVGDSRTAELAEEVANNIFDITGHRPHLVINHIKSNRLNANRNRVSATDNNPDAQKAFDEFHGFIDYAKAEIARDFGGGHFFDMHTNAHSARWTEIGQLVSKPALNSGNNAIMKKLAISPVKQMTEVLGVDFIEITKGETSLGGLLSARGVKAVPSPKYPKPGSEGYFNGGWNTNKHGSRHGGAINATQIENAASKVNKKNPKDRAKYSKDLSWAIMDFMAIHYGMNISPPQGQPLIPTDDAQVRGGSSYAKKNYGGSVIAEVNNGSSVSSTRISYFKFDLSSVDQSIQSAKLRFFVENTSKDSEHNVSFVSDDNWLENTITYNNRPDIGSIIDVKIIPTEDGIIEFDVTSQVAIEAENDDVISFAVQEALHITKGFAKYHTSKSAGRKPQLIINK